MSIDAYLRDLVRAEVREAVREELRSLKPSASSTDMLTVQDVAAAAQVSVSTVRAWIRDDLLKSRRAGRSVRIYREDLKTFLESDRSAIEHEAVAARIAAALRR